MAKHKRVSKQGFTLVELLMVLCVVSVCMLILTQSPKTLTSLPMEIDKLKSVLLKAQREALLSKQVQHVQIEETFIVTADKRYQLPNGVNCGYHDIFFNERGNVNQARTITCSYKQDVKQLIVHLGSGNIYAK
ncbi:hypothetical protein A4S06_09625 [Erysipelotrichaceae bacterium MTC7]|nr:hypothetical protein A4S06_09625 [Erysipelotrichaceae bacterium MTC7]